ncbi:hypothetical protein [Clostridium saccharobutylicum]|uniref:Uncharacterized protein n=1 Tax=Clostridium saccharobutylicum TaxID=169679 RepID=A0A1S8MSR3_CLOSA|nr:hypothetical protein [Clostridium saccharobutylicum]OOM07216.1 hypothetical protein CLOSAC_37450 [Clostridium saccharobutylicum]
MAIIKQNAISKNDFAAEEDIDIYGFSTEPIITGDCISSFSFDDNSINETKPNVTTNAENKSNVDTSSNIASDTLNFAISPNNKQTLNSSATSNNKSISNIKDKFNNTTISSNQTASNKNNTLEDNRKAPLVNGMAPLIDGEYLNVKRTYMLRDSTVREINELKSIHPELNTYVSTIVDLAIAHYYEHIINGGKQ